MMDSTEFKLLVPELVQWRCAERPGAGFPGNHFHSHLLSPVSFLKHPDQPGYLRLPLAAAFLHAL